MRTWIVTGASGFVGRHVLEAIAANPTPGRRVVGLGRRPPKIVRGIFVAADLDSPAEAARIVSAIAPSVVIHAAGLTPPAPPEAFYRANTLATIHLLDALRSIGRPVRVVLVGSAAELGPVPTDHLPVSEDEPCRPADAYGLSKLLATTAGLSASPPLEVIAARIFNPIGPGLPAGQALGRFAEALANPGDGPVRIDVGDLDARRDFVDVRDAASALVALALHGRGGSVYHVGSGRSRRVGDGLDALIGLSGRRVEVVPGRSIAGGPGDSRADIRKICGETGWAPEIAWERSLADLWDERVGRLGRH